VPPEQPGIRGISYLPVDCAPLPDSSPLGVSRGVLAFGVEPRICPPGRHFRAAIAFP